MPKQYKHILVIRLSAMGDVAMFVPVLRAVLAQNKYIKITILSSPFFEPFFKDMPNTTFIAIDKKGKHKGILGLIRLARLLNALSIDVVADIHNVLRSKVITKILQFYGTPYVKIDKGRLDKKALTRAKNKVFLPLKTTHERYADVFRNLGCQVDLLMPVFPKKQPISKELGVLITHTKLPIVGIAPFAAHKGKQYPIDAMARVISELSRTYQIVLFGSKSESVQLEKYQEQYKNCISVAGKISFSAELQLISNIDVMLAMDSGNAHLAAMYGVKVVTVWGVTHPFAGFAPFHQPIENCMTSDVNKFPLIPTSIYGNTYPEGYLKCFDTILPETIIEKVKQLLQ